MAIFGFLNTRELEGFATGLAEDLGRRFPPASEARTDPGAKHQIKVILERVNRFFGWQAVGRLALRQAPLTRHEPAKPPVADPAAAERVAATLNGIADDKLRAALARLGAAVKGN